MEILVGKKVKLSIENGLTMIGQVIGVNETVIALESAKIFTDYKTTNEMTEGKAGEMTGKEVQGYIVKFADVNGVIVIYQ